MDQVQLVVDACSLINLHATEQEVTILNALRVRLLTTPRAAGEVQYRYGPLDDEGQRTKVAIDLNGLISIDLLQVVPLDAAMTDHLVNAVTAGLRDADASVVALAQGLGHVLVTDDNKVRKVSAKLNPALSLDSTLGLLRRAADALRFSPEQIRTLIAQLAYSGNFIIPKTDPHRSWWEGHQDTR